MTFSAFMMAYFKSLGVDQRLAKSAGTRGLRQGQLLANMLREFRPDLADMLRGSELDPFYRFSVRSATWTWLADNWDITLVSAVDNGSEVMDDQVG